MHFNITDMTCPCDPYGPRTHIFSFFLTRFFFFKLNFSFFSDFTFTVHQPACPSLCPSPVCCSWVPSFFLLLLAFGQLAITIFLFLLSNDSRQLQHKSGLLRGFQKITRPPVFCPFQLRKTDGEF